MVAVAGYFHDFQNLHYFQGCNIYVNAPFSDREEIGASTSFNTPDAMSD